MLTKQVFKDFYHGHKEVFALNIAFSMITFFAVMLSYLISLFLQKSISFTNILLTGISIKLGINIFFIFLIFVAKTLNSLIKD